MTINTFTKKSIFHIFSLLAFLFIAGMIHTKSHKPEIILNKQSSALNLNQDFLKLFSVGQNRLLADFFWIVSLLESDLEHYKNKDLNSWLYLRFKSIIELDPYFKRVYRFGGQYLGIVTNDLFGSQQIFIRGIHQFPNDYDLLFSYGYLLAFEMKNYKKALPIYEKLLKFPQVPSYIKSLIPKLIYSKGNDLASIYPIVNNIYESEREESPLKKKLRKDLYAIKAEIDLRCLNMKMLNCDTRDHSGDLYLNKNGFFYSKQDFKKYRLHTKE